MSYDTCFTLLYVSGALNLTLVIVALVVQDDRSLYRKQVNHREQLLAEKNAKIESLTDRVKEQDGWIDQHWKDEDYLRGIIRKIQILSAGAIAPDPSPPQSATPSPPPSSPTSGR